LPLNWVFGGVLEAYGVTSCSQLPRNQVEFSAFYIDNAAGVHVAPPTWTTEVSAVSPSCGFRITYPVGGVVLSE
jgi:hypothetical protein